MQEDFVGEALYSQAQIILFFELAEFKIVALYF